MTRDKTNNVRNDLHPITLEDDNTIMSNKEGSLNN